ncbi:MAG: homoserine O-succinyltransferase [Bacteroidota bacterium]
MPLILPDELPAIETLRNENVFVMSESHALHQDIRALRILILNLMPLKITTEKHILRNLSNSPLQVEIGLLRTKSYTGSNTPIDHLEKFYKTFDQVNQSKYDGMIITGAPVEQMEFEEVDYWEELKDIMEWTIHHVTSTLYICWGVQAGLYYHYGIPKYPLPKKMFGVFPHTVNNKTASIVRGFDDIFLAPHSRYTEIRKSDVATVPDLEIISESEQAGLYILAKTDGRQVFVTGHSEYDPFTLKEEYDRDVKKGLKIEVPENYFPNNDPTKMPIVRWRSHANLLFSNWLNYYVYQRTPYDLEKID